MLQSLPYYKSVKSNLFKSLPQDLYWGPKRGSKFNKKKHFEKCLQFLTILQFEKLCKHPHIVVVFLIVKLGSLDQYRDPKKDIKLEIK